MKFEIIVPLTEIFNFQALVAETGAGYTFYFCKKNSKILKGDDLDKVTILIGMIAANEVDDEFLDVFDLYSGKFVFENYYFASILDKMEENTFLDCEKIIYHDGKKKNVINF